MEYLTDEPDFLYARGYEPFYTELSELEFGNTYRWWWLRSQHTLQLMSFDVFEYLEDDILGLALWII